MRMDGSREKILGTVHASDVVTWVSGELRVALSQRGRGWDGDWANVLSFLQEERLA